MAAYHSGVRRLINLGSSCMYPKDHTEKLTEKMLLTGELEPSNEGYALAKIVVAKLCQYINKKNTRNREIERKNYNNHNNFKNCLSNIIVIIIVMHSYI